MVGGLVGSLHEGAIVDSYAVNAVNGGYYVGGLVGSTWNGMPEITNSYAADFVYGWQAGGILGSGEAEVSASYWDVDTTLQETSLVGIPATTAELQNPTSATGIYADWDPSVWDFGTSSQYPALKHGKGSVERQRQ